MLETFEQCNCGKPVRYTHHTEGGDMGSCNKYFVCKTYEQLLQEKEKYKEIAEVAIGIAVALRTYREGTQSYNEADSDLDKIIRDLG